MILRTRQHSHIDRITSRVVFVTTILGISLLTGCNLPSRQLASEINVTQAYETVAALLTSTNGAAAASATPSPSPSSIPSLTTTQVSTTANQTNTPTTPPLTWTPTAACDQASAGTPIDVTIPDDTVLGPNQSFTKIWRLENSGTCTWDTQYAITFFSGDQMKAQAVVPLPGEVTPGQSVDIEVDMIAPSEPGIYQGNWKLRNRANVLFGIGPNNSSPIWVRIEVAQTPTPSPTAPTPTLTPTPTATQPPVEASGSLVLQPADMVDLDTVALNPNQGSDLLYTANQDGDHYLIPQENVTWRDSGKEVPDLTDCQASQLNSEPINVQNTQADTYLCVKTNRGLPGWIKLVEFDLDVYSLDIETLIWAIP